MNKLKNIVLIVLLIIVTLFLFRNCNSFPSFFTGKTIKTTDTLFKVDTFYLEKKPIIKIDSFPKYIINEKYTDSVVNIYKDSINKITLEKDKISFLLNQLKVRNYDTTYYFGLSKINIKEQISGKLLNRNLTYYPYEVNINSITTVNNQYYPKNAWSIGGNLGQLNMGLNQQNYLFLGASAEYKNAKGLQYQLEYSRLINAQNDAYILKIGLLKEIFVNYKK